MTTTAVDDQFAPEPIQELEQEHHDKIVGIIAEKIEAERRPAPHGWKLVPVEPTPDWIANLSDKGLRIGRLESAIEDMLAAAPTPPAAQASVQDDEMVSLGGTAPPVPRWLLDAVQRIGQYMDAHSPGDWVIGGVQKRQASGQSAADEIEGLRAHVALLKSALAQSERENDELRRAQPAAATAAPSDEEIDAIAASMPDGAGGMLKQWGYRQFARALLARYGRQQAESAEPATSMQLATHNLQPVACAFFTEKGEVAYTGLFDRTLKALEAVKTTRLGISSGSIDLYADPVAAQVPAASIKRDAEFDQFLTDVMTAAGLVTHGRRCKALGERLGARCMKYRTTAAGSPLREGGE